MLNQVPRTLLNIGIDPVDKDKGPEGSPPFDWNSLTLAAETKAGDGPPGGASALTTPHSNRVNGNGGGGGGSTGRSAEFFGGRGGGGTGHDEGAPPLLPAARGRGARAGEKGSKGEGPPMTPSKEKGRLRSAFTNESIADQALTEFGDGTVSTRTVDALGVKI